MGLGMTELGHRDQLHGPMLVLDRESDRERDEGSLPSDKVANNIHSEREMKAPRRFVTSKKDLLCIPSSVAYLCLSNK
jgi:hypothetical protein